MSRYCELTGIKPLSGNKVSHSNRKARIKWLPNLKQKRYFIPELSEVVRVTLSTSAIRTIDKQGGLVNALFKADDASLSPNLLKIKNLIKKKSTKQSKKEN
jgi:large subunit ribosomal protein L28